MSGCGLVDLTVEERKISITIPPRTPRFLTSRVPIPKGEVWRIIEIVSLSRTVPDVELALQIDGVPQARVNASSIYIENESKPTSNAFANCVLGHADNVNFVATPLAPAKDTVSLVFRLRIQKEELI